MPTEEMRKDSKTEKEHDTSKDFIKRGTGEWAVVSAWNKLPKPANHHIKLDTKRARRIVEYLKQMREGTFGRDDSRIWDEEFLERHGIDKQEFESRCWTFREIIGVIQGPLADMYKDGYWPTRKDYLPHSLPDALYNDRSHVSFFMFAAYDPPGAVKDPRDDDPYPDITRQLIKQGVLDPEEMSYHQWCGYFDGVEGLAEYLKEIDWSNWGARQMFMGGREGHPYSMIMQYVKWMKGENTYLLAPSRIPERFHSGMIRPQFWMWKAFMESVNRYWRRLFINVYYEDD